MCTPGHFFIRLPSRTAGEIQRNIVKRSKRNVISRRYHAKDDRKAISAWNSDLKGIRRVFDVRFVTPVRPPLTARFQTELGTDTRATDSDATNKHAAVSNVHRDATNPETVVSGVRHDVSNTQPIVSGPESGIASTRTTASDIHRSKLKSRNGQNQAVNTARTLSQGKR